MTSISKILWKVSTAQPEQVEALVRHLFVTNSKFRAYISNCYTKQARFKEAPVYKPDIGPDGMAPSNLDLVQSKFFKAIYDESLKEETANKMLVQVFESVDKIDAEFLKQCMKGYVKVFPKGLWQEYVDNGAFA